MELGLHIADFTWNGGVPALGPTLARHARNAEAAGITRITVMDHFWQIRGVGPAEHEMLESYTTLGFLAAHTEKVLLHTLVTGVIYREPGLLAKQISTLDVLSGGGAGERKTLRLVAQYADACNISASPEAGRKLGVLRQHCEAVGRDYAQIEK